MLVDYAIIGGGIAGLYASLQLAKRYPTASIAVYEKYNILGGRVLTFQGTYSKGTLQWEKGAGRIHETHTLVRQLLKDYSLREAPLDSTLYWKEHYDSPLVPNPFDDLVKLWLPEVKRLPTEVLATHTIHEVLTILFGAQKARDLTLPFPYFGEIFTLRADLAIKSFEHEMGSKGTFYYSPDGYSTLIERLANDCRKHKVDIYTNFDLLEMAPSSKTTTSLFFATGPLKLKDTRPIETVETMHAILALHQEALKKINLFNHLPLLHHVQMLPLHRIYAVFPSPWFEDIPRFCTGTPIRYFIPIDPKRGIVMISYTDGGDTVPWMSLDYGIDPKEETLAHLLTEECRKLFPDRTIPYPTILKSHPWDYGCSYWLPGTYDPRTLSNESLQPFGASVPIYICGESFCMNQAWMEGALENTRDLLRIL